MQAPSDSAFRETMASVCSPVTVVSALDGERAHATTVSAFCSVSLVPPLVLVALDRGSDLLAIVERTRRFGVTLLVHGEDQTAVALARKGTDKLAAVEWRHQDGLPRVSLGGGWLACDVEDLLPGGDHAIVLGRVRAAEPAEGAPLAYHRRRFGTHSTFVT